MEAVRHESVHHIAIANPKHAPYGKAAEAALRSSGLWEAVQPKIVLGENVSQALQFVQSGNAEIGIVALSLALAPGNKRPRTLLADPTGHLSALGARGSHSQMD